MIYNGVADLPALAEAFPNSADPFSTVTTHFGEFSLPICTNSIPHPFTANIIFATFALFGGYIMMSLNLAAVAIGINERLEQLRNQELYGAEEVSGICVLPNLLILILFLFVHYFNSKKSQRMCQSGVVTVWWI